jgi:DUF4097 and DUF4098 domain-containing protein YvlB
MTNFQKVIKYAAMAFAIFLTVSIIGGILSVLGLFGRFFGDETAVGDLKTYEISSEINVLEVNISAADFTIKQGEIFSVESDLKYLTVKDKGGVLTIKDKGNKRFNITPYTITEATLTLYIPANTVFEKAVVNTGAGRLTVDYLSADMMNFELGAGEVKIDTLIAKSSVNINGGAGKITISDGSLHNLDLEMGIGQLNLTSSLIGENEFELGIGETNITVIGNKDDYKISIDKGLGNVRIDGTSVSDIRNFGNGNNTIDISGGIGDINLKFTEAETDSEAEATTR